MDPSNFPPSFTELDPVLFGRALIYLFPVCFLLYFVSKKYYYRIFFFFLVVVIDLFLFFLVLTRAVSAG